MKILFITLFILTFNPILINAQTDTLDLTNLNGKYVGQVDQNGTPDGFGELISGFGGGYIGYWKNGVYHGEGTKTWHTGDVYTGNWKLGTRHGKGRMTWSSSMYYEGDWKNNNQHGSGKIVYPQGNSRKGKWVHGQMHGKGLYKSSLNGDQRKDNYYHGYSISSENQ